MKITEREREKERERKGEVWRQRAVGAVMGEEILPFIYDHSDHYAKDFTAPSVVLCWIES